MEEATTAKTTWPETRVENLTKEAFEELLSSNVGMTAYETVEVTTKIKIIVRSLQVEKTITNDQAQICDVMLNEFANTLMTQYKPDEMTNLDEFFGRLFAYTVKSCTTPGAIVKLGKAAGTKH
jgi:hypothetical protein